ncbi:MAG TPA: glycosyltransferase family 4 protein [Kiritimatiellia bacterium]|nr:glycosyltransferase family 4 protein [Kiritimatiellia bacterium]
MSQPQRIAIVHYHLRPGGVTSVIGTAVNALRNKNVQVAVLTGGPAPEPRVLPEQVAIEGLNYSTAEKGSISAADIVTRLRSTARKALGGAPDLWHFHNHSIGKSCALTGAVHLLAAAGEKLLLQLHDFAEDGRPANYHLLLDELGQGDPARLAALMYPQGTHVHYASLNARDRGFLCHAGIPADRVHLLPNAIGLNHVPQPEANHGTGPRLFLYPTRAIRRKNLGEFLLWSALAEPRDRFASTLFPTSPADRVVYDRWVEFATQEKLPVDFGIGQKRDIPMIELLASAHAVVSTSVAEGFGLAFLEPWLAHRPLLGRDIPDITAGFLDEGLDLSLLYTRLLVPIETVGRDTLTTRITAAMRELFTSYHRDLKPGDVEAAMNAATEGDAVDFGRLDEALQQVVIQRIRKDTSLRAALQPNALRVDGREPTLLQHNEAVVRKAYNIEQYGTRLQRIYDAIQSSTPSPLDSISGEKLLDAFLAPERFFLLRT